MIKIGLRHNLRFPLILIIFNCFRRIDLIIMEKSLRFDIFTSLLTLQMFLGEFVVGLIIYVYQKNFLSKKKSRQTFMGIELVQVTSEISTPDKPYKIYLLLFFASFFDFVEFILSTFYLSFFKEISKTLEMRLSGLLTISSALFFIFLLKLQIFKHQVFSLIIIFICLIIIVVLEFLFTEINIEPLMIIFSIHFFNSLLDSIEKYLIEFNYLNPFKTLMMEGLFGVIITSIYSFRENPFREAKEFYNNNEHYKFIILIFLLFLYFVLCGGRNVYRVLTNKIYSPMTKSLTDYILNPLLILYYYFYDDDFNKNLTLFIINLILSIIIVLFGCIYNDILVLFCCDLEHDTHLQVSLRATIDKNNIEEESEKDSFEDDDNDDNMD